MKNLTKLTKMSRIYRLLNPSLFKNPNSNRKHDPNQTQTKYE